MGENRPSEVTRNMVKKIQRKLNLRTADEDSFQNSQQWIPEPQNIGGGGGAQPVTQTPTGRMLMDGIGGLDPPATPPINLLALVDRVITYQRRPPSKCLYTAVWGLTFD